MGNQVPRRQRLLEEVAALKAASLAAGWDFKVVRELESELVYATRRQGGAWRRVSVRLDDRGEVTAQELHSAPEPTPSPQPPEATPVSDAVEGQDQVWLFINRAVREGVIGSGTADNLLRFLDEGPAIQPAAESTPVGRFLTPAETRFLQRSRQAARRRPKADEGLDIFPGFGGCGSCGATISQSLDTCPHCGHRQAASESAAPSIPAPSASAAVPEPSTLLAMALL